MAKKMKRLLALVLALALVGGQMVQPVMATEIPEDAVVEVTAVDNGTQTVTTYTEPDSGAEVTVTQTQTADPATGTSSESTVIESVQVSGDGSQTEVNTSWQSTEVTAGSDTQGTNPVTTTETDVTTQVEGSETVIQSDSYDPETGIETVNGQLSGEETTTVTGTTVTTTVETGVVTDRTTVTEKTEVKDRKETVSNTDTGFRKESETDTGWQDGDIQEGEIVSEETESSTAVITPEHEGDVTLEMKPDEQWVTKSYEIGLEDLADVPEGAAVTEKKDKDGKVVGWIVSYQEKVTTTEKPTDTEVTEGKWEAVGQQTETYVNPGDYKVGTTTRGDDLSSVSNGESVTTKIEEIYVNGVYQGYRIITTTTTKVTGKTTDEEVGERTNASYEKTEGEVVDTGYTMPEEPVAGTTTDADGNTTTVSYVLIEEEGQPRGYAITTEIRSPEGKLIRTEKRNIYGTAHTSQTTVETDPVAERTTTTTLTTRTDIQEIRTTETTREMEKVDNRVNTYETTILKETDTYELIETEAGTFFLYQGKMYQVEAIGSHGEADVDTLTPDMDLITAKDGKDLKNYAGTENGLMSGFGDAGSDEFPDGYEFRFVGFGAASQLAINYGYTNSATVQFALRDSDGRLHYVYCCDLNTSTRDGAYYEIENLKDAGYYSTEKGSDIVDHIRTVATNGFWATEGGANDTGTLEAVKALLKKYDSFFSEDLTAVADSLTEGQALSATQAALWKFGNQGSKPNESNIVFNDNGIHERNVKALYELLISDKLKDATVDTSTDLIDKEDITSSSVTIHGEATNDDGSVKTVGGNTVYNTDVSFQLNVEKSSITGNLVVKVIQDGKVIRTEQIATEDSNFVGKILAGNDSDGGTTYTIEGLELIEGIKFTLNLEGTQDMEEGVYLYTAQGGNTASQTFVGVASGERDVDLEVDLVFEVSDPEVKHTNKVVTAVREDTQEGTRVTSRTDKKVNTETRTSGRVKTNVSHAVDVVSNIITTETRQDITREERSWESYWEYLLEIIRGDDGGDGEEDGPRGTTIPDEEVPLADAPRTGDISGLWAAVSALSLAGAAYVSIKCKEEEI